MPVRGKVKIETKWLCVWGVWGSCRACDEGNLGGRAAACTVVGVVYSAQFLFRLPAREFVEEKWVELKQNASPLLRR